MEEPVRRDANPMRPLLGSLAGVKDLADGIKLFRSR
jgi:hypothetical protein